MFKLEQWHNDEDVVLAAVRSNIEAFEFASETLKDTELFVIEFTP